MSGLWHFTCPNCKQKYDAWADQGMHDGLDFYCLKCGEFMRHENYPDNKSVITRDNRIALSPVITMFISYRIDAQYIVASQLLKMEELNNGTGNSKGSNEKRSKFY